MIGRKRQLWVGTARALTYLAGQVSAGFLHFRRGTPLTYGKRADLPPGANWMALNWTGAHHGIHCDPRT